MISRRVVLHAAATMLAITSAIGLSGCMENNVSRYRFREKIVVDTPQGVRTGSAVYEVKAWHNRISINGQVRGWALKGEAVAVDLPGGQTLFALLRQDDGTDLVGGMATLTLDPAWKGAVDESTVRIASGLFRNEARAVARANYPMMVRFRDINDPKTVETVDPDHLDKSFGPGVRLKFIAVQVTDDAVTTGIEKRLGWWNEYRNRHFDGSDSFTEDLTTDALAAHLSSGAFSTEYRK